MEKTWRQFRPGDNFSFGLCFSFDNKELGETFSDEELHLKKMGARPGSQGEVRGKPPKGKLKIL